MAEAILSDIAVELILKLGSSVLKEIGLWWGLTDELHKLQQTVSTIQAVLLDAEEKSMENHQVKNWLGLLSEAMYDADDLLDEFSTESLRQQVASGSKTARKECRSIQWLPPLNQLPHLRKLWVDSLTKLEYIDVDVNYENIASSTFFPSLTNLVLMDCPNLKGFVRGGKTDDVGTKPSSSISMEVLPCFPCLSLSGLAIQGCPNLTCMPLFPKLKTLQSETTK